MYIWISIYVYEIFIAHIITLYILQACYESLSMYMFMLIHKYHGEFLLLSLSMLLYPISTQYT